MIGSQQVGLTYAIDVSRGLTCHKILSEWEHNKQKSFSSNLKATMQIELDLQVYNGIENSYWLKLDKI